MTKVTIKPSHPTRQRCHHSGTCQKYIAVPITPTIRIHVVKGSVIMDVSRRRRWVSASTRKPKHHGRVRPLTHQFLNGLKSGDGICSTDVYICTILQVLYILVYRIPALQVSGNPRILHLSICFLSSNLTKRDIVLESLLSTVCILP